MVDVKDEPGIALGTLKHQLDIALNDAELALSESTKALQAWGDAIVAFREGTGTAETAVKAEEVFDAALARRLMADAKVEYLQKKLGVRS